MAPTRTTVEQVDALNDTYKEIHEQCPPVPTSATSLLDREIVLQLQAEKVREQLKQAQHQAEYECQSPRNSWEGPHPELPVRGWHRHENGGGWVEDTAIVGKTVFVSQNSIVAGVSTVLGSVMLMGGSVVMGRAYIELTGPGYVSFLDNTIVGERVALLFRSKTDTDHAMFSHCGFCGNGDAWRLGTFEGVEVDLSRTTTSQLANPVVVTRLVAENPQQLKAGMTKAIDPWSVPLDDDADDDDDVEPIHDNDALDDDDDDDDEYDDTNYIAYEMLKQDVANIRRHFIEPLNNAAAVSATQGDLRAKTLGWHRHPNGNGWVQDSTTVGETVHVSQDSFVAGTAKVTGNVRIESGSAVFGNAIIGTRKLVTFTDDHTEFVLSNGSCIGQTVRLWISGPRVVLKNSCLGGNQWECIIADGGWPIDKTERETDSEQRATYIVNDCCVQTRTLWNELLQRMRDAIRNHAHANNNNSSNSTITAETLPQSLNDLALPPSPVPAPPPPAMPERTQTEFWKREMLELLDEWYGKQQQQQKSQQPPVLTVEQRLARLEAAVGLPIAQAQQ